MFSREEMPKFYKINFTFTSLPAAHSTPGGPNASCLHRTRKVIKTNQALTCSSDIGQKKV